jgi:hypothetical protein
MIAQAAGPEARARTGALVNAAIDVICGKPR